MNPQAQELNQIITNNSEVVFSLLSKRGKEIFFPKKGILAQAAEAKGKKINATIGEAVEDDGTPMRLKSIEEEINISPSLAFPYAPSPGKPDTRTKWKTMLFEKNPFLKGKEISLPVVSCALTHGLSIMGYMFADEGDKIILSDLYWENYGLIFSNAFGADLDTFKLFKSGKMDTASLKETLTKGGTGKKILLLNFPNNPAGYTPTVQEAKEIVAIIKESADKGNKIVVIIDDAYFGLVFEDGILKESLFSFLTDIHKNVLAVKLDGPTKEDYVWGFRVGFITYGILNGSSQLYGALESKTAGAIRGNISNVSHLSQSLLMKAYESPSYQKEKLEKYNLLKKRYEAVKKALNDNPQYKDCFSAIPYNSGYFMCVELNEGIDGEKVRKLLLEEYDTGLIAFGQILRVAFSSVSDNKIPELFENVYKASSRIKNNK